MRLFVCKYWDFNQSRHIDVLCFELGVIPYGWGKTLVAIHPNTGYLLNVTENVKSEILL